jgi:hypothetical protein
MRSFKPFQRLLKDTAPLRSATRRVVRQSLSFLLESKKKIQASLNKGKEWLKKHTIKRK